MYFFLSNVCTVICVGFFPPRFSTIHRNNRSHYCILTGECFQQVKRSKVFTLCTIRFVQINREGSYCSLLADELPGDKCQPHHLFCLRGHALYFICPAFIRLVFKAIIQFKVSGHSECVFK